MAIDPRVGAPKYATVRLNELIRDGRFNRPVNPHWVDQLVSRFKLEALGRLTVSKRGENKYVVLDGQHRAEALRKLGVAEHLRCVPVNLFEKLTLEDEAYLFKLLNETKHVSALQKFKAMLTAGDPEAAHINSIAETAGFSIGLGEDYVLDCVSAVERVYRLSEPKGETLERVLDVIRETWGGGSDSLRAQIITGLGLFVHDHPDVEDSLLVKRLATMAGGPLGLLGRGRLIRGSSPQITLPQAIAMALEKEFKGRTRRSA